MKTERRCVWLTHDHREHLLVAAGHLFDSQLTTLLDIVEAYDAAPADPVEAVREAFRNSKQYDDARAALRALGWEKP